MTQNLSDVSGIILQDTATCSFVTFSMETGELPSTGKIEQNKIYELNGKFSHNNFFSLTNYKWQNLTDRIMEEVTLKCSEKFSKKFF